MGITLTHVVSGRQLPWLQHLSESLEMVHSTLGGPHLPGVTMAAKKGTEYGSAIVGGVRNGVTEADMHRDLNPGRAAMRGLTTLFQEWRGSLLTTWLKKQESNM